MKAYLFPGQGSQYKGMGRELFQQNADSKVIFEQADEILGFSLTEVMFNGSEEDLKQTKITQPAIFTHSIAALKSIGDFEPDMVAGHSLGEFTALVAAGALTFKAGLELVYQRAMAMQEACEMQSSTMAAVLGLEDHIVEEICENIEGIVVAANYNCPGQLVISGEIEAINKACDTLKNRGARRALVLPVGGAFHSPLMESARVKLEEAIQNTDFESPVCAVYQNVDGLSTTDVSIIKEKLIRQLTSPVKWTHTIEKIIEDGADTIIEVGPGKVLVGLARKIDTLKKVTTFYNI